MRLKQTLQLALLLVLLFGLGLVNLLDTRDYALLDMFNWRGGMTAFYAVFALSLLATWGLTRYSHRLGLMDEPNHRSVHDNPVPRSGGLAISVGFFAGMWLLGVPFPTLLVPAVLLIVATGVVDDLHHVGSKAKFVMIFIAATLLYFEGIYVESVGTFLGIELTLGWLALPFLWFVVSGFTNAMNLIDGLDGLAGSVGIIILLALAYVGYRHEDPFLYYGPMALVFAILGFLWFNWHPARIFMGDSGSLTIGFLISVFAIHALQYLSPVSILLIAALPILDTVIVMVRRILSGGNPFRADRTHIHHIVLRIKGGNVPLSVFILASMQFLFTFIGLSFKVREQFATLMVFTLIVIVFYHLLTPTKKNRR